MIHEETHRTDSTLERLVVEALARDPHLSSQPIDVRTEWRTLCLCGTVQNHRRKLAAQRVVEAIVERVGESRIVENRIEVSSATTQRSDAVISESARASLEQHAGLQESSIVVTSRAGRVTLAGTVATERERTLAADVVLSVEGVRGVNNLLVTNADARRLDGERGAAIERLLANTPELAHQELRVAVTGENVMLSGRVRSEPLRRMTVRLLEQHFDVTVLEDLRVGA